MNEQLIVKNFGPIKDATVDFKRVTVFIGPTGGGKSTLAKLAAIFRTINFFIGAPFMRKIAFEEYGIDQYFLRAPRINWKDADGTYTMKKRFDVSPSDKMKPFLNRYRKLIEDETNRGGILQELLRQQQIELETARDKPSNKKPFAQGKLFLDKVFEFTSLTKPVYVPAERAFVSAIERSWAGLMRDDIGLPKLLLNFANEFAQAREDITELKIDFISTEYSHRKGQDFIKPFDSSAFIRLSKAASGIQSVTPLLVLVEYLSRNTEQAQSFIIEEPELNLYPAAQQGLLNWLVEKCTKGENDLTITTHSPYILSHLNLLLYAHHVGNKDEEKRQKVAAIIPEKYWVNPDDFAAYYVNGPEGAGGVRSLLDPETKLISQNELDAVSGIQADEFDQLLDINRGF